MLPITPEGPNVTAGQAKILDDEFFTARPLSYFSARIASLLEAHEAGGTTSTDAYKPLWMALGISKRGLLEFTDSDRQLQVAVDSLATRHHAAEALVRLLHALVSLPSEQDGTSTWATIADGPNTLHAVTRALSEKFEQDTHLFSSLFVPDGASASSDLERSFTVSWKWFVHAVHLLTSNELTVNVAHNKLKHGLAVRARDDVRIELLAGPGPDADGNLPLSSFRNGNSIPIFDRPMVTYLARPYAKPPQGLEIGSLRIEVPLVLAETWMIAVVYAAIFHVAAKRHFGEEAVDVAPYPTLPTGPTPEALLGHTPLGYRGVVTLPPDASTPPRESGLFFPGVFWPMTFDFNNVTKATVIEG
jgi:hypothetical protein